jgi:hypothetical protein
MLLSAGKPVNDVAGRLGHANANVTLAVYAHAMPENQRGRRIASPNCWPLAAHGSASHRRKTARNVTIRADTSTEGNAMKA